MIFLLNPEAPHPGPLLLWEARETNGFWMVRALLSNCVFFAEHGTE